MTPPTMGPMGGPSELSDGGDAGATAGVEIADGGVGREQRV